MRALPVSDKIKKCLNASVGGAGLSAHGDKVILPGCVGMEDLSGIQWWCVHRTDQWKIMCWPHIEIFTGFLWYLLPGNRLDKICKSFAMMNDAFENTRSSKAPICWTDHNMQMYYMPQTINNAKNSGCLVKRGIAEFQISWLNFCEINHTEN